MQALIRAGGYGLIIDPVEAAILCSVSRTRGDLVALCTSKALENAERMFGVRDIVLIGL